MAYTCRQFIEDAFIEAGLASYIFDLQPEQWQAAQRRLDAMMADWNGKGIRLGYPIASEPGSGDLNAVTNVPDSANEAVITNLAIRIAPMFGKQISIETKATARESYNTILARAAMPSEMQMPENMPAGAGNRSFSENNFLVPPFDPLLAGQDGQIEF